jgi:N-acylglucosamine-6-phosphate 2-epimerase
MHEIIEKLRGRLVVSCQALPGNPLRESGYMAVMAKAAELGGAGGIRANGAEDIQAIREQVKIPIIGINKTAASLENVYITPTLEAAVEAAEAGADIIALDATNRPRPGNVSAAELIRAVKRRLGLPVMADISTYEEGMAAAESGADIVATTLAGYTAYTSKTDGPDLELLKELARDINVPLFAEGRILTPDDLKAVFKYGAFAAVVGKMITNPMFITQQFINATENQNDN